jgi:hypothetical protein
VTTAFRYENVVSYLVEVIVRIDLVQGTRDCSGTPSLIDAQIGDDIRDLPAAVAFACGCRRGGPSNATTIDAADVRDGTYACSEEAGAGKPPNVGALPDDLRRAPTFGGQ